MVVWLQPLRKNRHGGRIVRFHYQGIFLEVLESLGEMPLPPYIHEKLADRELPNRLRQKKMVLLQLFQRQVFISPKNCSKRLKQKGSPGLFDPSCGPRNLPSSICGQSRRPWDALWILPTFWRGCCFTLRQVKAAGKRIVAVGTTSIRTLETIGNKFDGDIQAGPAGNIFIKPGSLNRIIDTRN